MRLMMVVDWKRTTLDKIGAKFASGEDAAAPEGATMLARWHDIAAKKAWIVVEADDAAVIQAWAGAWSEFIDWEIHTIIDDEEIGPILDGLLNR